MYQLTGFLYSMRHVFSFWHVYIRMNQYSVSVERWDVCQCPALVIHACLADVQLSRERGRRLFSSPWQQLRFHVSETSGKQTRISICTLCARCKRNDEMRAQIKREKKSKGSTQLLIPPPCSGCVQTRRNALSVPVGSVQGHKSEMLTDGFCFDFHRRWRWDVPRFLICGEFLSVLSVQKPL